MVINKMHSKTNKKRRNIKKVFIITLIAIVPLLLVSILLSTPSSTKIENHLQKIFEVDNEFTNSLDQIQLIFLTNEKI